MKKAVALLLVMVFACMTLAGCSPEINCNDRDVLYKEIVYQRCDDFNYNISLYEDNARYIGDFLETYSNGNILPWAVYALNGDEDVLYSSHATWVKPGYALPANFGEELSCAEYVVSSGIDYLIMEDNYTETATTLITFEGSVKLEDIVQTAPSELSEYVEYDTIRFRYAHRADMALLYTLCGHDGKYYLNVRQGQYGSNEWHEIKPEYVDVLTSKIEKGNA
jgi:hypothetical protein